MPSPSWQCAMCCSWCAILSALRINVCVCESVLTLWLNDSQNVSMLGCWWHLVHRTWTRKKGSEIERLREREREKEAQRSPDRFNVFYFPFQFNPIVIWAFVVVCRCAHTHSNNNNINKKGTWKYTFARMTITTIHIESSSDLLECHTEHGPIFERFESR